MKQLNKRIRFNDHTEIAILTEKDINSLITMTETVDLMEFTYKCLSGGVSFTPQRTILQNPENNLLMLLKPSFINKIKRCSIKIITQNEDNRNIGLPIINGIVILMDSDSGQMLAMMDGAAITSLRTGAASGLATKLFSNPNSKTAAIFGCGVQGSKQLEAVLAVRNIKNVLLYDVNKNSALKLIEEINQNKNISIEFTDDLNRLKEADVICLATNSQKPLFERKHIKKGVHINAIGSFRPQMQEVDPQIMKDSLIYLDDYSSCMNESGDLIKPIQDKVFSPEHIKGEIGSYLLKKIEGRNSENDITLFKSVGVAIQDLVVANAINEKFNNH